MATADIEALRLRVKNSNTLADRLALHGLKLEVGPDGELLPTRELMFRIADELDAHIGLATEPWETCP